MMPMFKRIKIPWELNNYLFFVSKVFFYTMFGFFKNFEGKHIKKKIEKRKKNKNNRFRVNKIFFFMTFHI